ncbi:hypothetical protein [Epilithonimonas arachidiradicis]|uniref:Uncharacterized protein n=1 Tax=Epilithonimonas arachidiradicis TaxID=1617282 RepID=A0A420DE26_9FLAO|nr:hypothetical protein [Epilithonimonas arachidiradicis]RKE90036.1 hypothetical protein BXY58_0621 [Epilithonimonas arachidiradicis]GGG47229.1 hypothetical protein GCM10007332_05930 [Epilithonimonas arachidiradicis]
MDALIITIGVICLAGGFCLGALVVSYCENTAPHLVEMEDSYQPIETVCLDDFDNSAKPLIKYLAENHHPHTTVIVTNNNAQLLEGITSTGEITEFLKD